MNRRMNRRPAIPGDFPDSGKAGTLPTMVWLLALLLTHAAQDETPRATLALNDGAPFTTSRTVTAHVECSGEPSLVAFSFDGTTWTSWRDFDSHLAIDLPAGDGLKTVRAKVCDRNAAASNIAVATITLDTTPPRAAISRAPILIDSEAILASDVPDAVGMQIAAATEWGRWLPYASPAAVAVPAGTAAVRIRYRDAAGLISDVLALTLEKADAPPLRDIRVSGAEIDGDGLRFSVSITAVGAATMMVDIDDIPAAKPRPFAPTMVVRVSRKAVAHRVHVAIKFDDQSVRAADVAFQEEDLTLDVPTPSQPSEAADAPADRVGARASIGLWFDGLSFDATTAAGRRTLDSGEIGLVQLDVQFVVSRPFFVDGWLEFAAGGDVSIFSGGADAGVTFALTPGGGLRLDFFAGPLASRLDVELSGFESFGTGFGLRAGALLSAAPSPRLRIEAGVEGRFVRYPLSGDALTGDSAASAGGAAVIVGVTWRF